MVLLFLWEYEIDEVLALEFLRDQLRSQLRVLLKWAELLSGGLFWAIGVVNRKAIRGFLELRTVSLHENSSSCPSLVEGLE
jgi:hypothetical protein